MTDTIVSYVITPNGLALLLGNRPYTIDKTHPNYEAILTQIRDGNDEGLEDLLDVPKAVARRVSGTEIEVIGNGIYYQNEPLHNATTRRLLQLLDEGHNPQPLIAFLENVLQNPSRRATEELYLFLEACNLPLTKDGCFLAYKRVRGDYFDVHSGTVRYQIGDKPSMPRNRVDDIAENTCSYGLHFCSLAYLAHFPGEHVMVVKINPKHVVSIPVDYGYSKGRTCQMEVVDEIPLNTAEDYWLTAVVADYDEEEDEYVEEDEEDDDYDRDEARYEAEIRDYGR